MGFDVGKTSSLKANLTILMIVNWKNEPVRKPNMFYLDDIVIEHDHNLCPQIRSNFIEMDFNFNVRTNSEIISKLILSTLHIEARRTTFLFYELSFVLRCYFQNHFSNMHLTKIKLLNIIMAI